MFDWFFALSQAEQFEVGRNTLATLGGLVALLIAANTYRRNVRIKREEQARLVYSKVTHIVFHEQGDTFPLLPNGARGGNATSGVELVKNRNPTSVVDIVGRAKEPLLEVTALVHNGSKELIGPARIQLVGIDEGRVFDEFSVGIAAIDPESDYVVDFTWINEVHPAQQSFGTTVIFQDASGQWWRRHLAEPIERVHNDPENGLRTPRERKAIRQLQESLGMPEKVQVKEPRVPFSARWHRFWRQVRGKTPLP